MTPASEPRPVFDDETDTQVSAPGRLACVVRGGIGALPGGDRPGPSPWRGAARGGAV